MLKYRGASRKVDVKFFFSGERKFLQFYRREKNVKRIDWITQDPSMRFNEKEIKTLAGQHKCEKEGNLYFRERQDGFFRKAEGEI